MVLFYILMALGRLCKHSLNPEKQEGVAERPIQKLKTNERVWNNTATEIKLKSSRKNGKPCFSCCLQRNISSARFSSRCVWVKRIIMENQGFCPSEPCIRLVQKCDTLPLLCEMEGNEMKEKKKWLLQSFLRFHKSCMWKTETEKRFS